MAKCSIHRTVTPSLQKKIKHSKFIFFTIYFVYFSEAVLATVTTRNIKAFALKKKCSNTFFKGQGYYMHIMLESGFKIYPQITIES